METKKLNMAMTILRFAIAIIGIIACIWVVTTSPGGDAEELAQKDFADSAQMGLAINFTIFTIVSAVVLVLLFFGFQLATNTKKTVMSIIGIVVAFFLFLILWAMGTGDNAESLQVVGKAEQGTINWVSAGIYTIIVGIVIAIVATRIGQIMSLVRLIQKK